MWSQLPPELRATSLFVTDHPHMPAHIRQQLAELVARPMPHDGLAFPSAVAAAAPRPDGGPIQQSHRQADAAPLRRAAAKEA